MGGGTSGVDAAWSGGLVDNRWVADDSLKQVQFECTNFQSVPLAYINAEGKKQYVILSDGTGFKDGVGTTGDSAYAGSIFADCKLANKSQLDAWGEKNKKYNGGSSDDFSVGVAVCPVTVADYISHFYKISMDVSKAEALAKTHALCLELLYNTTETQGKAFRLKVVDSTGQGGGYQGSLNRTGGWKYAYDCVDTMGAVMLTKAFADIITLPNTKFGILNSDKLYFPWKDQTYNYKTATIQGYSPSQLLSLGLQDSEEKISLCAVGFKAHHKAQGHALARGRFFADEADKDKIRQVVPNMPDEFFKTNYADGSIANFSFDLSQFTSVGAAIRDMAAKVMKYAKYLKSQNNPMKYGGCSIRQYAAQSSSVTIDKESYYIPAYRSSTGLCNCDAFVNWVLLECGLTKDTKIQDLEAKNWSASDLATRLSSGYSAIKVPDITAAEAGDILVYDYKNGHGHCAIFESVSGASISGYGMGSDSKCSGDSSIPAGEPSTSSLKEIIRVVKV